MVKVRLVDYTRSGTELVYRYLKELTYPKGIEEILGREPTVEEMMRLVVENQYWTVLEHIYFTFELTEMSMAVSREFLEHRMASHMGRSSRGFQPGWQFTFEVPARISGVEEARSLYVEAMGRAEEFFNALKAKGVKQEDARNVLPLGTHCAYLWTVNAHSLINFLGLRLCPRSYIEIQQMAQQIYDLVYEVYPELFKWVGCRGILLGVCPENEFRDRVPCPFKDPTKPDYIPTKKEVLAKYGKVGWRRVDWALTP